MGKSDQSDEQLNGASEIREFKPDGLKQRLIGAIVLVSLAVIFLPMVFDEPHQEKKNIVIPIPEKPLEKIVTFEVPKPPKMQGGENQAKSLEIIHEKEQMKKKVVATVPESDKRPAHDASETADSSALTPQAEPSVSEVKPDTRVVPVAKKDVNSSQSSTLPGNLSQSWVVQLGTFGNKANALMLRDKARSQGYSTHTTDLVINGKSLTRVFSGPFISKDEAVKVKSLLDKKFNVSSIVVKFAS